MAIADPGPQWTYQEIADTVRKRSVWMEVLGILLVVLGAIALAYVIMASVATTYLIGILLLAAGAAQIAAAGASWQRRRGGFILGILLGSLTLLSGLLCLVYPASSMLALTLILGIYFIASGISRLAITARERFPGWGWGVASAVAEIVLGILTLAWWPNTSLVVLGSLLGVQLIFSGANAFAVGSAVRAILAPRAELPRRDRPATRFQH